MKRELWQTIVELVDTVSATQIELQRGVRISDVTLETPLNIVLRQTDVGFKFLADAPEWRLPAGISDQPGRLRLTLVARRNSEVRP